MRKWNEAARGEAHTRHHKKPERVAGHWATAPNPSVPGASGRHSQPYGLALGVPAKSRKLDSMSLMGPFPFGIFGLGQWSVHLELASSGSVRHRGSFWQLLLKSTPAAPPLPTPCHANPVKLGHSIKFTKKDHILVYDQMINYRDSGHPKTGLLTAFAR